MSDFEYDSYDSSTLKVAFQNLRKAEREGFWLGIIAGFPLGIYFVSRDGVRQKLNAGPLAKGISALVIGSLMYFFMYSAMEDTFSEQDNPTMT